ncbi:hypothetical protein J3B02_004243, partial [Coemansia erecta]
MDPRQPTIDVIAIGKNDRDLSAFRALKNNQMVDHPAARPDPLTESPLFRAYADAAKTAVYKLHCITDGIPIVLRRAIGSAARFIAERTSAGAGDTAQLHTSCENR